MKYGGSLLGSDSSIGAAVRGDSAPGQGFRLTTAWNAAMQADQNAVPGLVPPTVTTPATNLPPADPTYKNVVAAQP